MCFQKAREAMLWGGGYLYSYELLLALFVDLWGAIGGQASTLGLSKLVICSYLANPSRY